MPLFEFVNDSNVILDFYLTKKRTEVASQGPWNIIVDDSYKFCYAVIENLHAKPKLVYFLFYSMCFVAQ